MGEEGLRWRRCLMYKRDSLNLIPKNHPRKRTEFQKLCSDSSPCAVHNMFMPIFTDSYLHSVDIHMHIHKWIIKLREIRCDRWPVIPALKRQRQDNWTFKATLCWVAGQLAPHSRFQDSLSYTARLLKQPPLPKPKPTGGVQWQSTYLALILASVWGQEIPISNNKNVSRD